MAFKTARTKAPPVDGGELFKAQFQKTVLCSFHASGRCRMGNNCNFAHDVQELCAAPDLTKTSLCRKFMKGEKCKDGHACPFAHGEIELRTTPMFKQMRQHKSIQEEQLSLGLSDLSNMTSKLQAKQPGLCIKNLEHGPFKGNCGPPGTFNFNKGDASWNAQRGSTPAVKMPQVFMFNPLICNGNFANASQAEDESAEVNSAAVQDSAVPLFLRGLNHPGTMQALESLLQNSMPDYYED